MVTRIYTAFRTHWQETEDVSRYLRQKKGFPLNVDIKKNISYGKTGDRYHRMDLYFTAGMEQVLLPTVIYIRGGSEYSGSKELCQAFNMEIASRCYAVVSIEYRPYARADFREQLRDVCRALCELELRLAELPCDRERLYLCGDSTGAMLAFYAAAAAGSEELAAAFGVERPKMEFRAAGFLSGIFFARGEQGRALSGRLRRLMLPRSGNGRMLAPWMEPQKVLAEGDFPPVFLQTSTEDRFRGQTLEMELLLTQHGVFHRVREWEEPEDGRGRLEHRFCVLHPKWRESMETLEEMLGFFEMLEKHMRRP